MSFFFFFAEALILAATLSIDSFAVAFSYGSSRIRIPFRSAFVLNGICCVILGISLFFGTLLKPFMPPAAGAVICFAILFLMFDVETMFLFPWAVVMRTLGPAGLFSVLFFLFRFRISHKRIPSRD